MGQQPSYLRRTAAADQSDISHLTLTLLHQQAILVPLYASLDFVWWIATSGPNVGDGDPAEAQVLHAHVISRSVSRDLAKGTAGLAVKLDAKGRGPCGSAG